jgi:hypothetical protein
MAAVDGFDPAKSGQKPADSSGNPVPVGVWGDTTTGVGVFGTSGLLPPATPDIPTDVAGVEGHSLQNPGVLGRSNSDAGVKGESLQGMGVVGRSESAYGVLGVSFGVAPAGNGLFGSSTTGGDGVVGYVGDATGVVGNSVAGSGVYGISGTGNGVVGENYSQPGDPVDPLPAGVLGRSELGNGVTGESTSGSGVFGLNDGAQSGVWGSNCSNDPGIGVKGTSLAGTGVAATSLLGDGVYGDTIVGNGVEGFSSRGAGVLGEGGSGGFAGVFLGNVRITGNLSKAGGGFEIDHPLDPENKYLSHSFVESPDRLNIYNGTVTTDDDGAAVVVLPGYFNALNHQCCYQLTVIGQFAQAIVAEEVGQDNEFTIKTSEPRITVSWQVTGIRQDPWAVENRIEAETEKTAEERGRYLHPELWERPHEARIHQRSARAGQRGRIFEEELARAQAMLPADLRQHVEERLQAILAGGDIVGDDLQSLIAECIRRAEIPRAPRRTSRTRLQREWHDVEEIVQKARQRGASGPGGVKA